MTCQVRLGAGFKMKAGKVVANPKAKDASARQRQKAGGSKKVRVGKGAEPAPPGLQEYIKRSFMRGRNG